MAPAPAGRDKIGKTEGGKLCPEANDEAGEVGGLGALARPPEVCDQFRVADRFAGACRKPPQDREFARIEAEPAILDPPVAVGEIERQVPRFAKTRGGDVVGGEVAETGERVQSSPPARIE